jgi:hypothetical protein
MAEVSPDGARTSRFGAPPDTAPAFCGEPELIGAGGGHDRAELRVHFRSFV